MTCPTLHTRRFVSRFCTGPLQSHLVPGVHSPDKRSTYVKVCSTVPNSRSSEPLDPGTSERNETEEPLRGKE